MTVTDSGITILFSDLQPLKAPEPISIRDSGNFTASKRSPGRQGLEHVRNSNLIYREFARVERSNVFNNSIQTVFGRPKTDIIQVGHCLNLQCGSLKAQFLKAFGPMIFTESGITSFTTAQPLPAKALLSMAVS